MHLALWIVAGVLALVSSIFKLFMPKEKLTALDLVYLAIGRVRGVGSLRPRVLHRVAGTCSI